MSELYITQRWVYRIYCTVCSLFRCRWRTELRNDIRLMSIIGSAVADCQWACRSAYLSRDLPIPPERFTGKSSDAPVRQSITHTREMCGVEARALSWSTGMWWWYLLNRWSNVARGDEHHHYWTISCASVWVGHGKLVSALVSKPQCAKTLSLLLVESSKADRAMSLRYSTCT